MRGSSSFGERVCGGFTVDGFENRLSLHAAELFDDIGQVGGMHGFQAIVRNIEAQTALRVGFNDVAEIPADGMRSDGPLHAANQPGGQNTLKETANNAADADVHFADL